MKERQAVAEELHHLAGAGTVLLANIGLLDEMIKTPGPVRDVVNDLLKAAAKVQPSINRLRRLLGVGD